MRSKGNWNQTYATIAFFSKWFWISLDTNCAIATCKTFRRYTQWKIEKICTSPSRNNMYRAKNFPVKWQNAQSSLWRGIDQDAWQVLLSNHTFVANNGNRRIHGQMFSFSKTESCCRCLPFRSRTLTKLRHLLFQFIEKWNLIS